MSEATVETVPAQHHSEAPVLEAVKQEAQGGAPVSQTTNLYPVQDMPTLGLRGVAATVANFSMAVVFVAVAIIGGWSAFGFIKEQVADLKTEAREERRDRSAAAEKAHRDFLDERKEDRESRKLMWQAMEKNSEATKQLGDKLDAKMTTLIEEVKKNKGGMGGGMP